MLERKWMKNEGSNKPYIKEIVKGIIQSACWCPYSVLVFIIGTSEVYKARFADGDDTERTANHNECCI